MATDNLKDASKVARQAQLDVADLDRWLPRSCLVYVTDARYLPLTLTSLLTASRTMPSNMDAIIYLDDVPQSMRDEAGAFLRDCGVAAELVDFDIDSLFADTARIPLWREGISRAGFARLGLCGAPEGYDTHVILDGDTLVGGDLGELVSVRPCGLAAVTSGHPTETWAYLYRDRSLPLARDYMNAGLMVLNSEMWRKERIQDHCMSLVGDQSLDQKLARPMRDQEILNLVFGETFHRLNPNWNFQRNRSWTYPTERPLIAHFTGQLSPWDERDRRALPVFRKVYAEVFARMPKALGPAITSLKLSRRNLRSARRFNPSLGRFNLRHHNAWNPANAPMVADWLSLLPWNR